MKARYFMLFLALCFANVCCADPELVGVLAMRDATYVAVRLDPSGSTSWIKIGDRVGDYRAFAYNSETETLLLRRGETEFVLKLPNVKVQPMPPLTLLASFIKAGDAELLECLRQARVLEDRRNKTAAELVDFESGFKGDPGVTELRKKLRLEEAYLDYYLQALTTAARDKAGKVP